MKLVVFIPAFNEQASIADVIRAVPNRIDGFEAIDVLVIDDGSTDETVSRAQAAGATVVRLGRRSGLGRVFRTGMDRAIRMGANVIVSIDGDGQFDASDIPMLIEPIVRDEADFATCTRFSEPGRRRDMPRVKVFGNRVITRVVNRICGGGSSFTDVSCGFRAFNQEAAYRLTLFGRFTYTHEVFIDLVSKGVRIAEVPLKVLGEREHGDSRIASSLMRYGVNSMLIVLRAMRDTQPLKFFGGISFVLGLMSFLGGGFLTYWYLSTGGTFPFRSLVTITGALIVLTFGMLMLALLADMISRHRRIAEESLYLARWREYRNHWSKGQATAGPTPAVDTTLVTPN